LLQKLHIINYAIIDEIEVDFVHGFNIITGETGAGKSILLGALSLILGDRADVANLCNKEKKCIVEGIFSMPKGNRNIMDAFAKLDIELENEIFIRREIAVNGKSRAFLNDTPINLAQLREISLQLVDLHQQFDTLELAEQSFQREVLDSIAGNQVLLENYQQVYKQYNKIKKELDVLEQEQRDANKTLDYNSFLYKELSEINLQPNELEQLEEELKLLNNVEHIKDILEQSHNGLTNGEQPLLQQLKQIHHTLKSISGLQKNLAELQTRLQASIIELDDIAAEVEQINDSVNFDSERLEAINDKINIGYKLLKKHGVQTTQELIAIQQQLEEALQQVHSQTSLIQEKTKQLENTRIQLTKLAEQLHQKRLAQTVPIVAQVNTLLKQVGMPNAVVKITCISTDYNAYGSDTIEFLFDANKTGKFEPIRKVASGGELSRLMLCIKSLVADAMQLPVLIFDEIDTGISGEAARQVGIIMSNLSAQHQVLCITHQAQIAAKAHAHYFVYKQITNNHITTGIKILSQEERITTIAQMLSGEKPTAAALQNAREMVGN
jgi:DNA repair protein RecN (Recombination protein N)